MLKRVFLLLGLLFFVDSDYSYASGCSEGNSEPTYFTVNDKTSDSLIEILPGNHIKISIFNLKRCDVYVEDGVIVSKAVPVERLYVRSYNVDDDDPVPNAFLSESFNVLTENGDRLYSDGDYYAYPSTASSVVFNTDDPFMYSNEVELRLSSEDGFTFYLPSDDLDLLDVKNAAVNPSGISVAASGKVINTKVAATYSVDFWLQYDDEDESQRFTSVFSSPIDFTVNSEVNPSYYENDSLKGSNFAIVLGKVREFVSGITSDSGVEDMGFCSWIRG